jgi:hypothetical protein
MDDRERASLKAKIDQLQIVYIVLLGGAVATRFYRTSLVNRYNADLSGRLE